LKEPKVAWCTRAIFEAECGGAEKLRALLGVHVAGFDSPSEGDRDRSLRAASLIYKHGRPRPVPGSKSPLDQLFDEMSADELRQSAEPGKWPPRLKSRLRAVGFTRCDDADAATPNAEAPGAAHADRDVTQSQPVRPPRPHPPRPEPDTAARVAHTDGDLDD